MIELIVIAWLWFWGGVWCAVSVNWARGDSITECIFSGCFWWVCAPVGVVWALINIYREKTVEIE